MPGIGVLVTLVAAGAAGVLLLDATIRRTPVGVRLVLVAAALIITFPELPYGSFGGFNLFLWDIVATLVLCAAVARLLRSREVSVPQFLLIAFGLVVLLSLVQGVFAHGLNTAVVEFRRYYSFVSIALYMTTVEPKRELLDRIGRAWMLFAAFLLLLTLLRWALQPFGLGGWAAGTESGMRVIGASATLVLLQGFVIGGVAWIRGDASPWIRGLTPALLAGVVLLQHRTVWAALLVVVTLMFLLERGAAQKLIPLIILGLVVVSALGMTVLDQGALELTGQLEESAEKRSTWDWRVEGWRVLLEQSGPQFPAEYVVGRPFGAGFDRVLDGNLVTVSPHSLYVEGFLRTGLLGVVLLAAMYITTLRHLASTDDGRGLLSFRTLFLLLVMHPIFFIPYTPAQEQGILLGLALATSAALSRAAVTDRARGALAGAA